MRNYCHKIELYNNRIQNSIDQNIHTMFEISVIEIWNYCELSH